MYLGAIEAGGTKFVCAVSDEKLNIIQRAEFPTTTPEETMDQVALFFSKYSDSLLSLGVGSFGPIDMRLESSTYGCINNTPKLLWKNYNILGKLKEMFPIPIYWTTDVNAALYGEFVHGAGKSSNNLIYYTVGTGVGAGVIINKELYHGYNHLELGHMKIEKHSSDSYLGKCPYHQNCLEGLAAGPSIEERLGKKAQMLGENHEYWDIEAFYLAQCAYNTTLMYGPDKIIFGGGVMKQPLLIDKIRNEFKKLLNDYVLIPDDQEYIVTPLLKDNAGVIGCLELAKKLIKIKE